MRILIIGAAGRTGRLVVEQALGHGHDVTALIHEREIPAADPRLQLLSGDATDFETVSEAARGQRAVVVAVGRSGGATKVHEAVAANVIHAMALHGSTRLAVMSAAGAFARSDAHLSLGFRAQIATTLRGLYDDLEAMERRVVVSDLDWTIVRPVGLSDDPPSGHYRVSVDGSIPPKVRRVSRADVAALLLKAVETEVYRRRVVVVSS